MHKSALPSPGLHLLDVFGTNKIMGACCYSIMSDQPLSGLVTGLSSNPPFTTKVSYTATNGSTCNFGAANCLPTVPQAQLYAATSAASISVSAVQPNYKNATTQKSNLNVQSELPGGVAMSIWLLWACRAGIAHGCQHQSITFLC